MQIMVSQASEGCIVSEDVFSMTNKPIIPKKTVLTKQHFDVLKAFLITTINVEQTLVSGESLHPIETLQENESILPNENDISTKYLHAVKEFKELFKGWQAGSPVDISKVRNIVIPLVEQFAIKTNEVLTLHHYSTKKDYIFHHGVSVGILSAFLARKMGYSNGDLIQLAIAGMLSDCGMAKIDPKIIRKPAKLTAKEYNEVKQHPKYSFQMIKKITALKEEAKLAILQHHERVDGSGYPLGLTSEKVHPFSKIVAVADVYHAMVSEHHYREMQSPYKVLEQMLQDSFGKFDIKTIHALTSAITNFSVGTKVKLSDGYIGEIVFVEQKNPTRPMVKLIHSGEIIQLTSNRNLFIEEIL